MLLNPLGAGLAHYAESLEHVLNTCGVQTSRFDVIEPSSADYGKLRWLYSYLLGSARKIRSDRPDAALAVWPAVGYWDVAMLTLLMGGRRLDLVMHDPRPLVYARGYGAVAKASARVLRKGAILAHSPEAAETITADTKLSRVVEVLHPMFEPRQSATPVGAEWSVRVLGQYKADRDVEGLTRLAANAPTNWSLEIVGRDWPPIDGWKIRSEFVAEADFDELIRTSNVVLIPYSRFYQSGVAIRALEWGVPVVGPYESSLRIALGIDCPWLVRAGDWTAGVSAALGEDRDKALERAFDLYERVIQDWRRVLQIDGTL